MARPVVAAMLVAPALCGRLNAPPSRPPVTHPWENAPGYSPYKDGAYTGPFTQLTDTYLNVSNPADNFGPEDKLVSCNNELVFIDLDIVGGAFFAYSGTTSGWTKGNIAPVTCPSGANMYPRDSGYTVGTTQSPNSPGQDRIVLVGGAEDDTNIFYSDDCGRTWQCSALQEAWEPRNYASLTHAAGQFPSIGPDVLFLSGGLAYTRGSSRDLFYSTDGGLTWTRPQCADANKCCVGDDFGCPMFDPDPVGKCSNATGNNWQACYTLPDWPVYPGSLAIDSNNLWLFIADDDDGNVYQLNNTALPTGWAQTPFKNGGFGRKVFIKGTVGSSGCWFSTDYLAEDLWLRRAGANSMNQFATAQSATGPWKDWTGIVSLPWTPRASAAVTSSWRSTSAWVASGMTFSNGYAGYPVFADAWQVDAGVCLLAAANGQVCGGTDMGTPNLNTVTCTCNPPFQGDAFCGSCTPALTFGTFPSCTLCPTFSGDGSACGVASDRGVCDPVQGCVCRRGFTQPATGCDSCDVGYWGPNCGVCPVCGAHGVCSGSGTTGGTGTCVCSGGWSGNDCSVPPVAASKSPAPQPGTPPASPQAAAASDAGAIAAGVLGGLIGLVVIGTFVYARFLGGGRVVAGVFTKLAALSSGSGSGTEKAGLIKNGAGLTETAAKARFSTYSGIGGSQ